MELCSWLIKNAVHIWCLTSPCSLSFILLQGSIISSPHIRRRATSSRDCPSRQQSIPNSSSLLGSLFGTKRGKSPSLPPQPSHPSHPTLISHIPHPTNLHHTAREGVTETQAQMHPHHAQICHMQNPPPYHHLHHYHPPAHIPHPPHQYHPPPGSSSSHSHSHGPHGHGPHPSHSQHAPHHHSQPPAPPPAASSTKPKHSGISTVVWAPPRTLSTWEWDHFWRGDRWASL